MTTNRQGGGFSPLLLLYLLVPVYAPQPGCGAYTGTNIRRNGGSLNGQIYSPENTVYDHGVFYHHPDVLRSCPHAPSAGASAGGSAYHRGAHAAGGSGLQRAVSDAVLAVFEEYLYQLGLGPQREAVLRPKRVGHFCGQAARLHDRQPVFHHRIHSDRNRSGHFCGPEEEHLDRLHHLHPDHGGHFGAQLCLRLFNPVYFLL